VAYHNWFALPERPVSDARAPFVLPEYGSEQKYHEERSSNQNRGHGLKCEAGLYGRSPDRIARVCNLCENGIKFKMRNTLFFHVFRLSLTYYRRFPFCLNRLVAGFFPSFR
jgi:hypothetical protein